GIGLHCPGSHADIATRSGTSRRIGCLARQHLAGMNHPRQRAADEENHDQNERSYAKYIQERSFS
ncbi:MAG: hypothetical protein ACXVCM_19065, partial [Ktedonobacteraceae bacterium]